MRMPGDGLHLALVIHARAPEMSARAQVSGGHRDLLQRKAEIVGEQSQELVSSGQVMKRAIVSRDRPPERSGRSPGVDVGVLTLPREVAIGMRPLLLEELALRGLDLGALDVGRLVGTLALRLDDLIGPCALHPEQPVGVLSLGRATHLRVRARRHHSPVGLRAFLVGLLVGPVAAPPNRAIGIPMRHRTLVLN